MPATPDDVARYTTDGVVVSTDKVAGEAIKAAHPDARTMGDDEIEMFFTNPAHAQVMLDEKFVYQSRIGPVHEGAEVEESLGLGTDIAIAPTVPSFNVLDDPRIVNVVCRTRGYSHDSGSERFAVEVQQ